MIVHLGCSKAKHRDGQNGNVKFDYPDGHVLVATRYCHGNNQTTSIPETNHGEAYNELDTVYSYSEGRLVHTLQSRSNRDNKPQTRYNDLR
jgi:hypothetical protein